MHLTFAERAYALARFYRNAGSKVILGGLHVISCPDEAAPHADAIAVGDGVVLWPHEVQTSLNKAIDAVTGSPGFAATARALARQNSAVATDGVLNRIAERCEQLSVQVR